MSSSSWSIKSLLKLFNFQIGDIGYLFEVKKSTDFGVLGVKLFLDLSS
jgi:hypothetical protein